jgi:S-adenosylmethionine:tRNA ribosyltransferase-isomerase
VPLPPYIQHADAPDDEARYQTVFAARPGRRGRATAALHFDPALLDALQARGMQRAHVTLHVGAGTFQPVRVRTLADHRMHSEWYEVCAATVAAIEAVRRARGPHRRRGHDDAARAGVGRAQRPPAGRRQRRDRLFITPGFGSAWSTCC